MEGLYKIKNDEAIIEQMICIYLLYIMVIFYMDATSVKLGKIEVSEETCAFYTIVLCFALYDLMINRDKLNKLQEYDKIIDLSIDLNEEYFNKEKALILYMVDDIKVEMNHKDSVEKIVGLEKEFKRYCGKINYQRFMKIVKNKL